MKYEIINPSDQCFIEHSDEKVAIAATIFLGEGKYGLSRVSDDNTVLPILLFGAGKFFDEEYGGTEAFHAFVDANLPGIGDALLSVSRPGERSSLNDIMGRAHAMGERIKARPTPAPEAP
jgi:hypothetical protein